MDTSKNGIDWPSNGFREYSMGYRTTEQKCLLGRDYL